MIIIIMAVFDSRRRVNKRVIKKVCTLLERRQLALFNSLEVDMQGSTSGEARKVIDFVSKMKSSLLGIGNLHGIIRSWQGRGRR